MATYHGITQVSCVVCNWKTQNDTLVTILNDWGGDCPKCKNQFFKWENQDGEITISLTQEMNNQHETITYTPKGEN